jgi:hypothetical protein
MDLREQVHDLGAMMAEYIFVPPDDLHRRIVRDVPALVRGKVWCRACGKVQAVDAAQCMATGWPTCCGVTMTIDSPEERRVRG